MCWELIAYNNLNQLVSQAMLSHTTDTGQRFVLS